MKMHVMGQRYVHHISIRIMLMGKTHLTVLNVPLPKIAQNITDICDDLFS